MSDVKVWRESNRIRKANGTGYNDIVTDDQIWKHIAKSAAERDVAHIEFALAVLRLRAIERGVAA